MLLGQIKKHLCYFLYVREKNSVKFHGRYVTSMSIISAVNDFSEKCKLKILWFLMDRYG